MKRDTTTKKPKLRYIRIKRPQAKLSALLQKSHGEFRMVQRKLNGQADELGADAKHTKLKCHKPPKCKMPSREVCLAFCKYPFLFEDKASAVTLLLLVLLAQVAQYWISGISLPIICYTSATSPIATSGLRALLRAIQGPEKWSGDDWQLRRPWVIHAQQSILETAPSQSPIDYIGGVFTNHYSEQRKFYFPYICSAMSFSPDTPPSVAKQIIDDSPLALPIMLGNRQPKNDTRFLWKFSDAFWESYNQDGLKAFEVYAPGIHMQICAFLEWLCPHKKRVKVWLDSVNTFRPFQRNGSFTRLKTDHKTEYLCAALALFQQYLYFASDMVGCISQEDARKILLDYRRLVLPESAPAVQAGGASANRMYDDPDVFYQFLIKHFLPTYKAQIHLGDYGNRETVGLIRNMDGCDLLIIPRGVCLKSYENWLTTKQITFPKSNAKNHEAAMQRTLQNANIPLRHEKNNESTWRCNFYEAENGTSKTKSVPCFGFPIQQLPQPVQDCLSTMFGLQSNPTVNPNDSDLQPNTPNEVKAL